MTDIAKNSINHLLPVMGKKLLGDIAASDTSKYQKARLAEGASTRTVNIEVACCAGLWGSMERGRASRRM